MTKNEKDQNLINEPFGEVSKKPFSKNLEEVEKIGRYQKNLRINASFEDVGLDHSTVSNNN